MLFPCKVREAHPVLIIWSKALDHERANVCAEMSGPSQLGEVLDQSFFYHNIAVL